MGGTQLHRPAGGDAVEAEKAPSSSPPGAGARSRLKHPFESHPVACVAFASFTVLRLVLSVGRDVLRHPAFVWAIGPHSPVASALVDPTLTLSHLREGHFLVQYSNSDSVTGNDAIAGSTSVGGTLDFAYVGEPTFRLPPLVLALFEPILSLSLSLPHSNGQSFDPDDVSVRLQNFLICLLLTLVDLAVAWGLYQLATLALLGGDDVQAEEEEALEKVMDPRILPRRGWMFGVAPGYSETASSGEGEDEGKGEGKDEGKEESGCETPGRAEVDTNSGGVPSSVKDGDCGDDVATADENGCSVEGNGATGQTKDERDVDHSSSDGGGSAETSLLLGPVAQKETDGEGNADDHPPSSPEPPILTLVDIPIAVAVWYYCNPISTVSCSMQSLRAALFLSYVSALLCARRGDAPLAALWVALASYVEVYPSVLLVPVTVMVGRVSGLRRSVVGCIAFFALWSAFLYLISFLLVGRRWDVVFSCHAFNFDFRDLSPNMGMVWYLFMEMFDQFRPYFVAMLNGLPYIFTLPLTIRLHRYPLALGTSLLFVWFIFKPVLTLQDVSFALGCLLLSPRSVARMGTSCTVALMSIVVPSALYVVDFWMWMVTGSGNANYMYFQCLAFDVFAATIMLDFVAATAKRDKAIRFTRGAGKDMSR